MSGTAPLILLLIFGVIWLGGAYLLAGLAAREQKASLGGTWLGHVVFDWWKAKRGRGAVFARLAIAWMVVGLLAGWALMFLLSALH